MLLHTRILVYNQVLQKTSTKTEVIKRVLSVIVGLFLFCTLKLNWPMVISIATHESLSVYAFIKAYHHDDDESLYHYFNFNSSQYISFS